MTRAKQLLTVYDLKSAECPFAKEIGKYISARKRSEQEAKKREAVKHLQKNLKQVIRFIISASGSVRLRMFTVI